MTLFIGDTPETFLSSNTRKRKKCPNPLCPNECSERSKTCKPCYKRKFTQPEGDAMKSVFLSESAIESERRKRTGETAQLAQAVKPSTDRTGLSRSQCRILSLLANHPAEAETVGAIATRLSMDRQRAKEELSGACRVLQCTPGTLAQAAVRRGFRKREGGANYESAAG